MRCPPLAIRWMKNDLSLAGNTVLSAVPTHADPRCVWSAVLVNLVAAMLLRGEEVDPSAAPSLVRRAAAELAASKPPQRPGPPLPFYLRVVPRSLLPACSVPECTDPGDLALDGWDKGYTLKAMQVALWCAVQAEDFEEALIAVVSAGGDTDTNGAVAGAILGARFGRQAIPDRWRRKLAAVREGREPLSDLADRLAAAA